MAHPSEETDCSILQKQDSSTDENSSKDSTQKPTDEETSSNDSDGSCGSQSSVYATLTSMVASKLGLNETNIDFYKKIYFHDGPGRYPKEVSIYFNETKYKSKLIDIWGHDIESSIKTINHHAPGLKLKLTEEEPAKGIFICSHREDCKTRGSILVKEKSKVYLHLKPDKSHNKRSIVLHEFLHALGFQHEHQRCDGEMHIIYGNMSDEKDKHSLESKKYFIPITAYDPYSIMHYPVSPEFKMEYRNKNEDGPANGDKNLTLSDLDILGLNIVYQPCPSYEPSNQYEPKKQAESGMYYCERLFNSRGTSNFEELTCSPGDPNCPACRVLSRPNMRDDQWQGKSGRVYCERKECLSHSGTPCEECCSVFHPARK